MTISKKKGLILASAVLLVAMVMVFFIVPKNNTHADSSITIHYQSDKGTPNVYYWNMNNSGETPVSWPGKAMTSEGNGWYSYTLPEAYSTNLIFSVNGKQTSDLYVKSGEWWYTDGEFTDVNPNQSISKEVMDSTTEVITVHCKTSWNANKVYYWNIDNSNNNPVTWPGEAMTLEENDWYKFSIPANKGSNLIFTNGSKQTGDLYVGKGEWWFLEDEWYVENPEADGNETTQTQTPAPTATVQPTIKPVTDSIKLHFYSDWSGAKIYYWNVNGTENNPVDWPGVAMENEEGNWYTYTLSDTSEANIIFNYNGNQTEDLNRAAGEWWYKAGTWYSSKPADNDDNSDNSDNNDSDDNSDNKGDENNDDDVIIVDGGTGDYNYTRTDFRDETIYFMMTTRFYDGDSSNNVHCWDDAQAGNPDSDPAWRGDFKGIIDQLDYIKALGFTAIWITPVVENASGYDYHGYHALDFKTVDSRYESENVTYKDLIDACHERGIKIIQDVVFNHTCNFGEVNLFPMFEKNAAMLESSDCLVRIDNGLLPSNYEELTPAAQYSSRIDAMKTDASDTAKIYHHEKSLSWESYTVQTGQIAGDCVDLNTENPVVYNYIIDAFNQYIDMGVDGFRVDTVKHISRLTFNKTFIPAFKERGGEDFYIFGEVCTRYRDVWNSGIPAISCPFYTWKESKEYAWGDTATNEASVAQNWADNSSTDNQPTSNNAFLSGNNYHAVDYSMKSGLDVIDFPMHWSFNNARDAFGVALSGDKYYNDATWNVTYVDSHDYAPDCAPENQRFAGSQDTWAENLNLMFTFRGIPCIYYGSEVEFQKGKVIDVGPNKPLSETGRAYFGDNLAGDVTATDFGVYTASGTVKSTLTHPLSLHIQRLNKIRQSVPALRKGQYSTDGVNGSMAFKRRYSSTSEGIDSFVLVSITDGATFSGIPNGKYVDAITGTVQNVSNGTLTSPSVGKGNMRVWVLDTSATPAPGKVGVDGTYLK